MNHKTLLANGITRVTELAALEALLWDTLTMTDLGRACKLSSASATELVDKFEKLGLAERRRVPGDRRKIFIRLTDKGVGLARET